MMLGNHVNNGVEFLDEVRKKGGKVLVHCQVGKSRSVSIAIAYCILYLGKTFDQAFKHIKNMRKIANPNYGFVNQLREMEKKISKKV